MKALLKNSTVLVTLGANLALGNLIVFVINSGDMRGYWSMALWYSLAAVLLLLGGFRRIVPGSRWWAALLLGLFYTILVPLAGSFMWAMAIALPREGVMVALGQSLTFSLLGAVFSAAFAAPFILINMLAFFLYLRALQRGCKGISCAQP